MTPVLPTASGNQWGTVRLRMTLWNVAVLALILGVMGAVVRYTVQADRFAAVDRTLAERAHEAGRLWALGPPYAGRTGSRPRLLDPMVAAAEGSLVGSRPRALPHVASMLRISDKRWASAWHSARNVAHSSGVNIPRTTT